MLVEGTPADAELLRRPVVEPIEEDADRRVERAKGEEGLVAEAREDPPLGHASLPASPRPPLGWTQRAAIRATDERSRCPEWLFKLPPDSAFNILRNTHRTWEQAALGCFEKGDAGSIRPLLDVAGDPLPGVTVEVLGPGTGRDADRGDQSRGRYRIDDLPSGFIGLRFRDAAG